LGAATGPLAESADCAVAVAGGLDLSVSLAMPPQPAIKTIDENNANRSDSCTRFPGMKGLLVLIGDCPLLGSNYKCQEL
jgi:hypothetical protein